MAKKTRKVLKQASQQRAIQQATANISTAIAVEAAAAQNAPTPVVRSARVTTSLPEDYRYVKADLRRIGVLAVSFTAVLIVLSFFIH